MSAQDLERMALSFLADAMGVSMEYLGTPEPDAYVSEQVAFNAIVAALRQQPAPVDLEQFREAVEVWRDVKFQAPLEFGLYGDAEDVQALKAGRDRADRLLSIIDNAKQDAMVPTLPGNWPEDANHENGDYECSCSQCGATFYGHKRRVVCKNCAIQPAPVVDDAMVARACGAYLSNRLGGGSVSHSAMRDALTAALAQGVQS